MSKQDYAVAIESPGKGPWYEQDQALYKTSKTLGTKRDDPGCEPFARDAPRTIRQSN